VSLYDFPSRLDLRHLRYFMVVAETQNFHRASDLLNIVQSALSRRILDLEKQLGLTLLERTAKGVALTEAGEVFLGHARTVISEADFAKTHLKKLAAGELGMLRLGLNRIAPQLPVVSQALQKFRQSHPGVELELRSMTTPQQLDALLTGTIDFGFLTNGAAASKTLEYLSVFKDYFILALSADHPLAPPEIKIRLADLADEDFIFISRATSQSAYDSLLSSFAAHRITPRIVQEGHSEDSHLGLVAAGMGLTFTYSSITARYHRPGLVFKPVEDLDIDVDIDLVCRRTDRSPLKRDFLQQMAAAITAEG
jgi:DNA-binding transcriptional LysR family regulator